MPGPDIDFWQARYLEGRTPWDQGGPSPQVQAWLAAGDLDASRGPVVVPGCGSGHEVAMLAAAGFDVIGLDYTPAAVALARDRLASRGLSAVVEQADVLAWSPAEPVAAIFEQTCLCALYPDHWTTYAAQLHRWLRPGGALLAMFLQARWPGAATGQIQGPPYHCDMNAMRALFPGDRWSWPSPPYEPVGHGMEASGLDADELAVVLTRR